MVIAFWCLRPNDIAPSGERKRVRCNELLGGDYGRGSGDRWVALISMNIRASLASDAVFPYREPFAS